MRDSPKILRWVVYLGTFLCLMGIFSVFKQKPAAVLKNNQPLAGLMVQNTYFGPTSPIPGNPHLIRVQVLIYDSAEQGGLQIQEVEFDGNSIPLKPRDIYGFRGEGTFQVAPGTYKLNWTVQRDRIIWPRTIKHEETVTIDPRDLWIQITIQGENAAIT